MEIRTYYWNSRKVKPLNYYRFKMFEPERKVFRFGNAGDIFNFDLIKFLYNKNPINVVNEGKRLLLVGSTMSIINKGDIVNGIGWKGNELNSKADIIESAKVFGVRGPLTRKLFEKYNSQLQDLKFEYDPGLLIKEVYNLDLMNSTNENVIFIPHYKDEWVYKGKYPKAIKVVSIDNTPKKVANEILKAKVVYSSSLHGIIFSHALGKECIFVSPQSEEPMFKYEDYYLSISKRFPQPIKDIFSIKVGKDIGTMLEKKIDLDDFYFPSLDYLRKNNILNY